MRYIIQAEQFNSSSYYIGRKKMYDNLENIPAEDCWKRETAALKRLREYAKTHLRNLRYLAVVEID